MAGHSRTYPSNREGGAYHYSGAPSEPPRAASDRPHSGVVARRAEAIREKKRLVLTETVTQTLAERRFGDAMAAIRALIAHFPEEPRWHKKEGELLRTLGRNREAAAAYRRAARRYDAMALPVRAGAALRAADALDGGDSAAHRPQLSSDRPP
jgi:predicted Zn-dependent protease